MVNVEPGVGSFIIFGVEGGIMAPIHKINKNDDLSQKLMRTSKTYQVLGKSQKSPDDGN